MISIMTFVNIPPFPLGDLTNLHTGQLMNRRQSRLGANVNDPWICSATVGINPALSRVVCCGSVVRAVAQWLERSGSVVRAQWLSG